MNQSINFQTIIMKLQNFWADQGCLIWQPYYSQVGAGTYNPATFLRALGPEPWRVAYVEPSVRPDDGRYGENPNRMQLHYQFQVLLKPDPGNSQEIYLNSLESIGVDPLQHDIRFVEDNWESPALGAWGLGWEVWLDGQEITQFTYFQQAGGQQLDPVSVEITYGLERIAMALQGVSNFVDIQWSPEFTDGDVNLIAEQEHSKYYFEIADIERLRQMYELYEAEAQACLQEKLVLPAYDYMLKCSHTFNVLDTRGAVGVTERQALFSRMRKLSRQIAIAYLEQRQQLEYPWLNKKNGQEGQEKTETQIADSNLSTSTNPIDAPFLLEIGTEELPVGDLESALEQLEVKVLELLKKLRLSFKAIHIMGTPRRLVVSVEALSGRQMDQEQIVKGPPASRAYDEAGHPTKAAQGFARSKGVSVEELEKREINGGEYVVAIVKQKGLPAREVLAMALPELIASLHFDKPMRWNSSNVYFSRPIRWLLALHGNQMIPFEFAGVSSGMSTRGLRFHQPTQFQISSPEDYFQTLTQEGIVLEVPRRKAIIKNQVEQLASEVNGAIAEDQALLSEVTDLVEMPTALRGTFNPNYLSLPREVLISVMRKHQRYFPVVKNGKKEQKVVTDDIQTNRQKRNLLPYFIAVRNGDKQYLDIVQKGNEHVIQARFADAAYFIHQDTQQSLESYLPKLDRLTFQVKLGSMLEKTQRIIKLTKEIAKHLKLNPTEKAAAERVAQLCKADLATQMVIEMTSLQGIMGRYYALLSGEPEIVAWGIEEHYLPRFMGDRLPEGKPGLVVGLADRLDTLVGLFSAGLAPSGKKDPFAQRRAALGLVQLLVAKEIDFDLHWGIDSAAAHLPLKLEPEQKNAVLAFIVERLRNMQLEQGERYDVVDAVLAEQGYNPASAVRAIKELNTWVSREDWGEILPAYSRCVRITRDIEEQLSVSMDILVEEAEIELFSALIIAEETHRAPGSVNDFLNAFLPMIPAINRFFDDVLVMTDDEKLRKNRLGLLQRIASLAHGVANMAKLEGF